MYITYLLDNHLFICSCCRLIVFAISQSYLCKFSKTKFTMYIVALLWTVQSYNPSTCMLQFLHVMYVAIFTCHSVGKFATIHVFYRFVNINVVSQCVPTAFHSPTVLFSVLYAYMYMYTCIHVHGCSVVCVIWSHT